jgi:hypothetical protein
VFLIMHAGRAACIVTVLTSQRALGARIRDGEKN